MGKVESRPSIGYNDSCRERPDELPERLPMKLPDYMPNGAHRNKVFTLRWHYRNLPITAEYIGDRIYRVAEHTVTLPADIYPQGNRRVRVHSWNNGTVVLTVRLAHRDPLDIVPAAMREDYRPLPIVPDMVPGYSLPNLPYRRSATPTRIYRGNAPVSPTMSEVLRHVGTVMGEGEGWANRLNRAYAKAATIPPMIPRRMHGPSIPMDARRTRASAFKFYREPTTTDDGSLGPWGYSHAVVQGSGELVSRAAIIGADGVRRQAPIGWLGLADRPVSDAILVDQQSVITDGLMVDRKRAVMAHDEWVGEVDRSLDITMWAGKRKPVIATMPDGRKVRGVAVDPDPTLTHLPIGDKAQRVRIYTTPDYEQRHAMHVEAWRKYRATGSFGAPPDKLKRSNVAVRRADGMMLTGNVIYSAPSAEMVPGEYPHHSENGGEVKDAILTTKGKVPSIRKRAGGRPTVHYPDRPATAAERKRASRARRQAAGQ